jgi:hypothetical protein
LIFKGYKQKRDPLEFGKCGPVQNNCGVDYRKNTFTQ